MSQEQSEPQHRVLIVDDELDVCEMLEHRLTHSGFAVESVRNGTECIERLSGSDPPDIVLLDVAMPKMNGFETLRRIKETDEEVLTIMLSGRDSDSEQIRAFELGAVDYVTKPFSVAVLIARIRGHLERSVDAPGTARRTEEWPGGWISSSHGT